MMGHRERECVCKIDMLVKWKFYFIYLGPIKLCNLIYRKKNTSKMVGANLTLAKFG